MHRVGAFLEAGGNKVFFVNGILEALRREGVQIDFLVGFSSSSPITLAYILGQNKKILKDKRPPPPGGLLLSTLSP